MSKSGRRIALIVVSAACAVGLSACTGVWVERLGQTPPPSTSESALTPTPTPTMTISPQDVVPKLSVRQYLDTVKSGWRGTVPSTQTLVSFGKAVCQALQQGQPLTEIDVVDIGTKNVVWNNDLVVSLAPYTFCYNEVS